MKIINQTATKTSLKDIKKSLDASQQLTADMQCNLKGGCVNCEDNRRPPRADSDFGKGSGRGNGHGNGGNNW